MFEGYLRFGPTEIMNSERTERYVAHQAPTMPFVPVWKKPLAEAVEDDPYESPALDDAPWFDANAPATADFFGLYPLDVTGVGDSTLGAQVTEAIGDGGAVGAQREASRQIRVHGVLVGATRLGAEAGLTWLRDALRSDECSIADSCGGGDAYYFLAPPDLGCKYGDVEVTSVREDYGHLVGPRTVSRQWQQDEVPLDMPVRARWSGILRQGTVVRYGAKHRFTDEALEVHGPVSGVRRNYVPNPSFRVGVDNWGTFNAATVTWMQDDGADGLGYAEVDGTVFDPTPVVDDGPNIYGEGTFGDAVYGGSDGFPIFTSLSTQAVATTTTDPSWSGATPWSAADSWAGDPVALAAAAATAVVAGGYPLLISAPLPVPAGPMVGSVALRASGTDTATFLLLMTPQGEVLSQAQVYPGNDWETFVVAGVSPGTVHVAVATSSVVDVDTVLVEVGSDALPYFDGDSADALWEGDPEGSTSVASNVAPLEISRPDGDWRPFLEIVSGQIDGLSLEWWLRAERSVHARLEPYERTFHNTKCTTGVQVIQRVESAQGAYFIEVDFILTAGNPHPYSSPIPVSTQPLGSSTFTDPTDVPPLDDEWLFDPTCLVPSPPPTAPPIAADCLEDVHLWRRYYVSIPAEDVALWAASVPNVAVTTRNKPISQIRVRLHPNPFGYAPQQVDPLEFCSEFIVSYLPSYTRLALNGMTRRASASHGGKATVSADHLLYGTGGGPMSWPELSCGVAYVMTVDVPQDLTIDAFDLRLSIAKRE